MPTTARCLCTGIPVDAPSVTDNESDRRLQIVDRAFEVLTTRPATDVAWMGGVTFTEEVPDRDTGVKTPMQWVDEEAGEKLGAHIDSPSVDDDTLLDLVGQAALWAIVRNDVHELCEHFLFDGNRVFDPHPNQRRWDQAPVDVELHVTGCPNLRAHTYMPPDLDWEDLDQETARHWIDATIDRVSFAPHGRWRHDRFERHADGVSHISQYPDRDSRVDREFSWTRDITDVVAYLPGRTGTEITGGIVTTLMTLAIESIAHEACEHLLLGGNRIFDPHPQGHGIQHDPIEPKITFHTNVLGLNT